jgi:hypothetical protein
MQVTPVQTEKILTGSYTFTQLGLSMLVTRLKSRYAAQTTPEMLGKCTDEINAFLAKYAPILAADAAIVSKL